MTDLNELFEQILHSERKFKARIDELKLLGSEVEQCQSELQHVREEVHTKQGELAVKRNKLADQVVETKVLRVRKQILQDQMHTLTQNKGKITLEFKNLEKEHESNRAKFTEELSKFSQFYDLQGSGCKEREDDTKRKIKLLQDELLLLETELIEMNSQREEVDKLKMVLTDAENELEKAKDKLTETRKLKSEIENETKTLEHEKKTMDRNLCQDPEFTRLQRELESCKESTEEMTCKRLSEELEELQRQCYHNQMRKQLSNHSKLKEGPSRPASSSLRSGHYNPYTHQYVPAPNSGRGSRAKSSSLRHSSRYSSKISEELDNLSDVVNLVDIETGPNENDVGEESTDEWDIGIEENELASFDDGDCVNADFVEESYDEPKCMEGTRSIHRTRGRKDSDKTAASSKKITGSSTNYRSGQLANSRKGVLPPSNFRNSEATGTSSTCENQTDFQQASSILNQKRVPKPASIKQCATSTVEARLGFTRGKTKPAVRANPNQSTRRYPQRNQTGPTSVVVLDSPDPSQIQRKRQGESIFKAPGVQQTQESSLPRRAKKVRFHY